MKEFREHYHSLIDSNLEQGKIAREPEWSESIAVGNREFVERVRGHVRHRQQLEANQVDGHSDLWTLREATVPYSLDLDTESSL